MLRAFLVPSVILLLGLSEGPAVEISEFQARGETRWIELRHEGANALSLDGYQLRVIPDEGTASRHTLSGIQLDPGESFAVIPLGSGPGEADLQLPRRDSFLALIAPDGTTLSAFEQYPEQRDDVSFGREHGKDSPVYFLVPTPGEPNRDGVHGFVADTKFSVDEGFHHEPFNLVISSESEDAVITYTSDGTVPSIFNPGACIYTKPIPIERTTVIRALATQLNHVPTDLDTQTYLFLDDVLQQPELPEGFPPSWGSGPGVVSPLLGLSDYAIDPRIRDTTYTDMDGESFTLREALLAVPSLCMTLPIGSLLDPQTGLHALARHKGAEWERPTALEYFDENGERAFQINAGFRMQGGWNRYPESFKNSFRYYFRGEYGEAKLDYRLFPDSPADRFDALIPPVRKRQGLVQSVASSGRLQQQLARASDLHPGSVAAGLATRPRAPDRSRPVRPSLHQRPLLGPLQPRGACRRVVRTRLLRWRRRRIRRHQMDPFGGDGDQRRQRRCLERTAQTGERKRAFFRDL